VKPWTLALPIALVALAMGSACSNEPDVGSPEWCEAQREPGVMDEYTMKEISEYAGHCMLSEEDEADQAAGAE